jgi:hypothetical protein
MTAPCVHGRAHRCPWPGCPAGVVGARLVVCGVEGAKYFARALDVVPPAKPLHAAAVADPWPAKV